MKFIATTTGGYLNADYVHRLFVEGKAVKLIDDFGDTHVYENNFADEQSAQNYLRGLIGELEKDDNRNRVSSSNYLDELIEELEKE